MKHIKLFCLLLVVMCGLPSCMIFQLIGSGMTDKDYDRLMYKPLINARRLTDTSKMGGEVIIFPMELHAKPHHLAAFKTYLDAKKADGYVVFYETVDMCGQRQLSVDQIDTLRRQARRVLGHPFDAPRVSYNKKIDKQYCRQNFDLTSWRDSLGLTTKDDHCVDMSVAQLVESYQTNVKPIVLTEADFLSPLDSYNYCPGDTTRHVAHYLIKEPRLNYIFDRFDESFDKKFIFVYSVDLDGYLIDRLLQRGYRSDYGFNAIKEYKNILKNSK